jgi:hypothetical protein
MPSPALKARRTLAAELQALHDKYDSWRDVQAKHYPSIPAGTLNTIAKSNGAKIPAKHYQALGLVGERRVWLPGEKRVKRKIAKMAKRTKDDVLIIKQGDQNVRK